MAWNEPGGDKKDPWSNRNDKGPPDLDEVISNLQRKLSGLFGGGSGRRGGGSSGGNSAVFYLILGAFVLFTAGTAFYTLQAPEEGVVTFFGRYERTAGPGLNVKIPWFVESVRVVNVSQNMVYKLRQQTMLTQDENIVELDIAVQYNVKDSKDFVFQVRSPELTLEQVVDSVAREVVGNNTMDFILKEGREAIAEQTHEAVQSILDSYNTGIRVATVNLERAQPPEAVQAAFSDANKAREDKERYVNEAEAFSNDIIPKARGDAQRLLEESKGYRTRVVRGAEGDTDRFLDLLSEYEKAPKVTRTRLYLDAIEQVLGNSSKIMLDVKGGNNIMYLPLDALMRNKSLNLDSIPQRERTNPNPGGLSDGTDAPPPTDRRSRETRP